MLQHNPACRNSHKGENKGHHAMQTYGVGDVKLHEFLTLALDGGEWSASRPGRFTPREGTFVTHWLRGYMGLSGGLDVAKKKIPALTGKRTPIFQPVA
jgi:hypothetical protein